MRVKLNAEDVFYKNYLSVVYKNQEYRFNNSNYIFIDIDEDCRKIYIKNNSKSNVSLNYLDLILVLLAGDGTITTMCADYSFEILSKDNCEILLLENKFNNKHSIYFESYCAVSKTAELGNDYFMCRDLDRLNKKSRRLSFLLMSGLPFYILLAFLLLVLEPEQLIIPLIAIFLLFTIPSIRQRRRIKKCATNEKINAKLLENVNGYRADENYGDKLKTKSEKFIEKIFSKMVGE